MREKLLSILLSTVLATLMVAPALALNNPWYIYGYVRYDNGTGVPNETVTLTDTNNNNSMTTTTDSDGFYSANIQNIPGSQDGDTIKVNCTVNNSGVIKAGENTTTVDLNLSYGWCNVTIGNLSIDVNQSNWNLGTVNLGETKYSNSSAGSYYFNLSNNGYATVNVTIQGENIEWDGHMWYLNTTADQDKFTLYFKKESDTGWNEIKTTNVTFVTYLPPGVGNQGNNWTRFNLRLQLPPTSTYLPPQLTCNVTFWAILS